MQWAGVRKVSAPHLRPSGSPVRLSRPSVDPLAALFGTLAVILLVVFLVLLGSTFPRSTGTELPYTTVQRMAAAGDIRSATQLDYDRRLLVVDRAGKEGWTAYPANGSLEDQLINRLNAKGATVVIDPQEGKQAKRIIVQVLLPILRSEEHTSELQSRR